MLLKEEPRAKLRNGPNRHQFHTIPLTSIARCRDSILTQLTNSSFLHSRYCRSLVKEVTITSHAFLHLILRAFVLT